MAFLGGIRTRGSLFALLLFLMGCATGYVARGPLKVDIEEAERTTSGGETVGYALYVPHLETNGCDRMPAVILLHGFQRDYRFHWNNAFYMAQRGIVVLTANMTDLWQGPSAQRPLCSSVFDVPECWEEGEGNRFWPRMANSYPPSDRKELSLFGIAVYCFILFSRYWWYASLTAT